MTADGPARAPRAKRWGLRTLAYLGLAAGSLWARSLMYSNESTDFVLIPFLGIVVGLVGAAVSSVRGLRAWNGFTPS